MKFEHLDIPEKFVKKHDIRKMKRTTISKILKKIYEQNMRKLHCSYTTEGIYGFMEKKCILMQDKKYYEDGYDLIYGKRFDEIIELYKKNDYMKIVIMDDFNPIVLMFLRNQVSEC